MLLLKDRRKRVARRWPVSAEHIIAIMVVIGFAAFLWWRLIR